MVYMIIAGTILSMLGYFVFLLQPVSKVGRDAPSAAVIATAMLVYQKAAVDWCIRTACSDGVVPPGELVLPPGYTTASWVVGTAWRGRVSVYAAGLTISQQAIADKLGDLTLGGASAGISYKDSYGNIIVLSRSYDASSRNATITTPYVPVNVAVISMKVR